MTEQGVERDLTGKTVEESDRVQIEAALSGLEDLRRELYGLPSEQIVVEGEPIPPVPLTPGLESGVDPLHQSNPAPSTLTSRDSILAKRIHDSRQAKKAEKKAA
ncbi:hypothetical protein A3A49_02975 [Candidatus Curtissbacteria bacterium RIFCSPLOWO2_01_FULL_38_11b]|uniref:Uncharacterized protein n=1 Tax=Candidatus Curtissbacteria bacterium RIFCSPLOWO2_01_FULL_38_11b TaxID=1797725 RepID=A0A1F5H0E5_9BACT|nr:MAG: hypothetical protein A3A49_02975 [Candidatus Curtissbacteria bacterium RIFCSPLOWO2_01_FULL_38_11b]